MPRPMPSAVTRLIAKMLTSVTCVVMNRARNEPSTATAPMTAGSPEATSVPKTSSMSSIVIGIAMLSARARSFSIVVPTSLKTTGRAEHVDVEHPVARLSGVRRCDLAGPLLARIAALVEVRADQRHRRVGGAQGRGRACPSSW